LNVVARSRIGQVINKVQWLKHGFTIAKRDGRICSVFRKRQGLTCHFAPSPEHSTRMNRLPLLALAPVLLTLTGCMTRGVLGKATVTSDGMVSDNVERPAFYALVPLALVGDAVTLPVQACMHFAYRDSEGDPWR
jgi:hypothetical protein